ncbi:MAG: 23S rRNA (adenine(2030)-N(6))-methyltransferase RlmJ [Bradyrhizobiaceae bacterium]|nr:MAG: 23S rRNA (adenine(2030)-N(6))-methyltransferase RlmJ [Bradyrhizobiaceae bacterium]
MNYDHAFHAGNFADVVKHAVLARIIGYLTGKASPFRIIDTHAGAGLHDLTGPEASRTGEWRDGIGRLVTAPLDARVRELLAPYLAVVAALNPGTQLTRYPGSPALACALMRAADRLVACELEPQAAAALARHLGGDRRVKVVAIDGYAALNAYVPPKERRGLVLVDPPFERPDESGRLLEGLSAAHRKWPTGIYLLWYPVKAPRETEAFARRLARLGVPRILRAELTVAPANAQRLTGTGLAVVNPPWTLEAELGVLLPALAGILAREGRGGVRIDRLTGEK